MYDRNRKMAEATNAICFIALANFHSGREILADIVSDAGHQQES